MDDDKKGGLLIALGAPKKGAVADEDTDDGGDAEAMKESAMGDFLTAFKGEDKKGMADALSDFCSIHEAGKSDDY